MVDETANISEADILRSRRKWFKQLRKVEESLENFGLQPELLLGKADYEIRGIATTRLNQDIVLVAGSKGGRAYIGALTIIGAGRLRLEKRIWKELPEIHDTIGQCPIDVLQLVQYRGELYLLLGTRGAGLWIATLNPRNINQPLTTPLRQVPDTAGLAIRTICFDEHNHMLYAGTTTSVLIQAGLRDYLRDPNKHLLSLNIKCIWAISSIVIDVDPRGKNRDRLFMGTDTGDIFSFGRTAKAGSFAITEQDFSSEPFLRQPGSGFTQLIPLSDYRLSAWRSSKHKKNKAFNGVVATTMRFINLIYTSNQSGQRTKQLRLKVPRNLTILSSAVGCFNEQSHTLVSGLDGRLYLVVGDISREGEPHVDGIFSGGVGEIELPYRAYNLATVPVSSINNQNAIKGLAVVTGGDDNGLRVYLMQSPKYLEGQADSIQQRIAESGSTDELINWMRQVHSSNPFTSITKSTLANLLPKVLQDLDPEHDLGAWKCLVHELLFLSPNQESLAFEIIGALNTAAMLNPELVDECHGLNQYIKKFVLDGESYSRKSDHRLELVDVNKLHNPEDAMVYGSILAETGYDPLFYRGFVDDDAFGEVLSFAPLLRPNNVPVWWEDSPEDAALTVASTYRSGLWLLDLKGNALRILTPKQWGLLENVYFANNEILLSYHDGTVRVTTRQKLLQAWQDFGGPSSSELSNTLPEGRSSEMLTELLAVRRRSKYQPNTPANGRLCFCPLPHHNRWESSDCLVGDSRGRIWLRSGTNFTLLYQLRAEVDQVMVHHNIRDLRSSHLVTAEGEVISYVLASTAAGEVHILRWNQDREICLSYQDYSYIDRAAISMMLWPKPESQTLVTTSEEGKIQCLRIVVDENNRLRLKRSWNYHTGARLNDVHDFQFGSKTVLILGCHDRRLHILDMRGHLLKTIHVRGLPFHRFCLADCGEEERKKGVLCHLYTCGFENMYAGLRILDSQHWTQELKSLSGTPPSEEDLLRWRGINIKEHFLRVRYYIYSETYKQAFPRPIVRQIQRLLDRDVPDEATTRIMCGLIQRMFYNPHTYSDQAPQGLSALLEDEEEYIQAFAVFEPIRDRWGLPGNEPNIKAQLYWIRSICGALRDLQDLRNWRDVGGRIAARTGLELADPSQLFWYFLSSPSAILQYKTLQYLEKVLLGWQEDQNVEEFEGAGLFRTAIDLNNDDIEFVLSLLINRLLWRMKREVNHSKPYWIILEVSRFLRGLLRHGLIDPLYLIHRLKVHGVTHALVDILIEQIEALLGEPSSSEQGHSYLDTTQEENLRGALQLLPSSSFLLQHLGNTEKPREQILKALNSIREYAHRQQKQACRYQSHLGRSESFLEHACLLFSTDNLESLRSSNRAWRRQNRALLADQLIAPLNRFGEFLEAAAAYGEARLIDVEGSPFLGLKYEHFQAMVDGLSDIDETLNELDGYAWEEAILRRALVHWQSVLETEREDRLLADFIAAMRRTVLTEEDEGDALTAARAAEVTDEARHQRELALKNLFLRLVLFGQPDHGILFSSKQSGENEPGMVMFDRSAASRVGSREVMREHVLSDDERSQLLSAGLADIATLSQEEIEHRLAQVYPWGGHWLVELMSSGSNSGDVHGFLAFAWTDQNNLGMKRYERHRLISTLLIQALALKQVQIEQRAFVGRFFSMVAHNLRNPAFAMRSGLGTLKLGWLEDQEQQKRRQYYEQMYRQAVHMQGIVESILSFRGQSVTPPRVRMANVAEAVLDAVKACRQEFTSRRMEIKFNPGPLRDLEWMVDKVWIYEIVQLLLSNALKYSKAGQSAIVSMSRSKRGLEISVTDSGPGVPKDERKQIFLPFQRGRYPDANDIPGLGLGLYIAKTYAEALGGRLQHRDNPEGGSIFMLFIPEA